VDLGENEWRDLAWLLELNQGFYNAASLASVSSLSEDSSQGHCWIGAPISPREGNERLEPIVTAFPISGPTGLNIVGPTTIGLRPCLQRDRNGLYNNNEIRALKVRISTIFQGISILTMIVSISGSQLMPFWFSSSWDSSQYPPVIRSCCFCGMQVASYSASSTSSLALCISRGVVGWY